jgi:hypothetical protein
MKMLNAVFIQPTFSCALNCKGCYVKESKQAGQMNRELLCSTIRYMWISTKFQVNQITLAVDDMPENEMSIIMLDALREVLRLKSVYGKKVELHLTCNSMKTLDKYIDIGIPLRYIAMNVDLISFSHLSEEDELRLEYFRSYTKVNYNYMPGGNLNAYRAMLKHVDMSYFLFYKTGLGRLNDPRAISRFKESLAAIANWSQEERSKITVDGCIRDAAKYQVSGFGCSANISRIHIWPDGHVTGCPYNKDGGKPARNMTGVIDNIEDALSKYEFKSCTIPRDYFSKTPTLRVLQ